MARELFFFVFAYLSGSVLYARVFGRLLGKDVTQDSPDGNPGTFNAFQCGGFWCGVLTLLGDLVKGFAPVFLYTRGPVTDLGLALVLAAPVLGHILPVFYHFHGGKGIAATFGCLLGLLPAWRPVGVLIVCFLFFSLILQITPHYHRTLWTYACACVLLWCQPVGRPIQAGFLLIAAMVFLRLHWSREEKEKCEVKLLWMR